MSEDRARPYLMEDWPLSDGRTFIAHAFSFYCMAQWGHGFEDIDAAFGDGPDLDRSRADIRGAAQLLGRALQQGRVETYARPFGGGSPRLLPQSAWELDDFSRRFGQCALDPSDPFNATAKSTHWIFVDSRQFDELAGILEASAVNPPPGRAGDAPAVAPASDGMVHAAGDRLLRKSAVLAMVPFSRSTLDDRVRRGLFPASRDIGGGIVAWWESEVLGWMAAHRGADAGS